VTCGRIRGGSGTGRAVAVSDRVLVDVLVAVSGRVLVDVLVAVSGRVLVDVLVAVSGRVLMYWWQYVVVS
jgi:hypothetical protein